MKNWIIALLILPLFATAQKANEQIIKSDVKKVKLFLTAGQMTHESSIKLTKGRHWILDTLDRIITAQDPV